MRICLTLAALALSSAAFAQESTDPAEPPPPLVETPPATTTTPTTTPTDPPQTEPKKEEDPHAFDRCVALARTGSPDVRKCLETIVDAQPDSLEATKARAARTMLDATALATPPTTTEQTTPAAPPPLVPPGRLELVGVTGVFGVWNAVAGGISIGSLARLDPGPALLGTAAGALVAGIGFGVGGYFLGDALHLDEGGGRLVASGLVWGTNVGIAMTVVINDAIRPEGDVVALAILAPIVISGYAGGAAGLAAAKLGRLDAAQVSLINSGGAMGSFLGGMVAINMLSYQVPGAAPYGAVYIAGNAVGLFGFGLLGNVLDITWGETLIGDLGMVIGGVVVGLGTVGILTTINAQGDPRTTTAIVTGAASAGVVGGYASGLGVVWAFRASRGESLLAKPPVAVTPATGAVLDLDGRVLPTVGLRAEF